MINFSNINNLQELESSLKDLKLQQINLLDVYNGTGNPYFTDLLNSHLFMHSQKPAEILRKIVDVDMSFDITTDNIVQQLFNMNFFNQPTTKPHDEVAKILVENFNLQSDTQVQYNMNTSEKFIANVNQDRLVKTLNNLKELNLLPKNIEVAEGLSSIPVNFARSLVNKINNKKILKDTVDILKNDYNLNEFAIQLLQNAQLDADLVLQVFEQNELKINFNIPSNDYQQTALQILADKNLSITDIERVLEKIGYHNVDWTQTFNNGPHNQQNFVTSTLNNIAVEHFKQFIELLVSVDQQINFAQQDQLNQKALNIISNRLNHDNYSLESAKYIVTAIAESDTNFQDVFIALRDKVKIIDLLSAYEDKKIDFNSQSQELALAMMYPSGFMPPVGMIHPMGQQSTSLLKEIFGVINDKKVFEKALKILSKKDIDWEQKLNGLYGDNILSKIIGFNNMQNDDIIEILKKAKEEYKLSFPLNSYSVLYNIADQINYMHNPTTLVEFIETLGFTINKGMMAIAFANNKNINLSIAADLFSATDLINIRDDDLYMIANVATKDNNPWVITASLNKLINLGFKQWEGNFGNGNKFLGAVIQNCMNLDQVSCVLSALSNTKMDWDFNHKNHYDQDVYNLIFMKPQTSQEVINVIKLLNNFKNIDWHNALNKILDSNSINSLDELIKNLPKEIDMLKLKNGETLAGKLVSKVNSLDALESLFINLSTFNVGLNTKIGVNEDSILTYLQPHLVDITKLLFIAEKLDCKIDLTYQNKANKILALQLIEQASSNLLQQNYDLLKDHTSIDWYGDLDGNKNNLLMLVARKNVQENIQFINYLLTKVDNDGFPLLNVNIMNNEGQKLIDIISKSYSTNQNINLLKLIQTLRELGSVEPIEKVGNDFEKLAKIDTTSNSFETKNNTRDTKNMVTFLNKFIPMDHIKANKIIEDFIKSFNLSAEQGLEIIAEWGDGVNDVLGVINQLKDLQSNDRINYYNNNQPWNFKTLLAQCIQIVCDKDKITLPLTERKNITAEGYQAVSDFIEHLAALRMCELGKYTQLAAFAQRNYLNNFVIDNLEEFYTDVLGILMQNKQLPKILTKWFNEKYIKVKPEEMSKEALMVDGAFNKAIYKLSNKYYSSIFLQIPELQQKLIDNLSDKHEPKLIKQWLDIIKLEAPETLNQLIKLSFNIQEELEKINEAFELATYQNPIVMIPSYFNNKDSINVLFKKLKTIDSNQDKIKFLSYALMNLASHGDIITENIAIEMNNIIISSNNEEIKLNDLISSPSLIAKILKFPLSTKVLIDKIKHTEGINWLSQIEGQHTLLYFLAHISSHKEDAIELYNKNSENWETQIHHVIVSGNIDEHFGDLIFN